MSSPARLQAVASLVTLAALIVPASARALAPTCAVGPSTVYTFTVETKWAKQRYRPGDTAKVEVTVSRPAPEDPLRQGIPWPVTQRVPAEGATVSTSMQDHFPPVGSYGETDAEGKVVLKFKIPRSFTGPADTYTKATKYYRSGGPDCTDVEEWGSKTDSPAFVVTG